MKAAIAIRVVLKSMRRFTYEHTWRKNGLMAAALEDKFAIAFGRSSDDRALSLPAEVALVIFGKLDEKSLIRCAFVSTSWYSFISKEKTLWLYHFQRFTDLPLHIITSALNQYPDVSVRKGPIRRSEIEPLSTESQQLSPKDKTSNIRVRRRRRYENDFAIVTENVLELAVVQHRGILHKVFSSLRWLTKERPVHYRTDLEAFSPSVTLPASGKTPQKVGRHTVLLKDSPTGPFTFYQLDSTSSQLVQKEYQVPHDFDPSTYVMEFLPQSRHSIRGFPPSEVELVSAPFAEMVVCLVRQRRCDSAAASTTGSHGAVTRVLWYDPDTLSIAAECDVSGKVSENDVCIFCQFCGLVAFIASGDTAHTSDGCKSSRVTAWSPYTPATPTQLSVAPFCPAKDRSVYSFLAGRQEGPCAAVRDGMKSGVCLFHRIVQCVVEGETATEMYSAVLITQRANSGNEIIEAVEEHTAMLSFYRPLSYNDPDFEPIDRLTAVLSSDNLGVNLFAIEFDENRNIPHPLHELLVNVDVSLQSFSTAHGHFYTPPPRRPYPCIYVQYYSGVYIGGPIHTVAKEDNYMAMYSTVFGQEELRLTANGQALFLWDYDILSRLPRPEGLLSDQTPLFIEYVEPETPPSKRAKSNSTEQ